MLRAARAADEHALFPIYTHELVERFLTFDGVDAQRLSNPIAWAMALAVAVAGILFVFRTPPCRGEFRFRIGGGQYLLFDCIQPPPPPSQVNFL